MTRSNKGFLVCKLCWLWYMACIANQYVSCWVDIMVSRKAFSVAAFIPSFFQVWACPCRKNSLNRRGSHPSKFLCLSVTGFSGIIDFADNKSNWIAGKRMHSAASLQSIYEVFGMLEKLAGVIKQSKGHGLLAGNCRLIRRYPETSEYFEGTIWNYHKQLRVCPCSLATTWAEHCPK